MIRPRLFALAASLSAAVLGLAGVASSQPAKDTDPDDRAFEREAIQRSLRENCLICHSDELINSQRLTPKQWKSEVEKMVGWGSPLPKELQPQVIDFLSAEYPADAPPVRPGRMSFAEADGLGRASPTDRALVGDPGRGASAYSKNCANCHGLEGLGADLGPNLVDRPVLYRRAEYDEVVRRGRGRMPGFASALDAASESDVLAWLRSRHYRPTATVAGPK